MEVNTDKLDGHMYIALKQFFFVHLGLPDKKFQLPSPKRLIMFNVFIGTVAHLKQVGGN